jgi:hypothetical protein
MTTSREPKKRPRGAVDRNGRVWTFLFYGLGAALVLVVTFLLWRLLAS